ncbi:22607_t:CDS:1 [Dentiscutata erythropus]|uniref:22607_t:CDS:1 n=1 Tax=Dentiscutata erythropus TaxID=1348616 RepID=A0A9N9DK00_9GLOM|nr:22607_t:CDS:1 [Dentiscutata erythropus]
MVERLPFETVHEIFEHLIQNNHDNEYLSNYLYSCLLVSRSWCREMIKVLWSKPFNFLKKNSSKLIQVYLDNLSKEERLDLIAVGINISDTPSAMLFDYLSFLKDLNFELIYISSQSWVELNTNEDENDNMRFNNSDKVERQTFELAKGLCKAFLSRCGKLKKLDLSRTIKPTIPNEYLSIIKLPFAEEALSQLDEFKFIARNLDRDILPDILKCCNSIRSLNMYSIPFSTDTLMEEDVDSRMESLCRFLSSQRKVKRLSLSVEFRNSSSKISQIIPSIGQMDSLNWIKFSAITFKTVTADEIVEALSNVQTLLFEGCTLTLTDRRLHRAKFHRLNKIAFYRFKFSLDAMNVLIVGCEETLREMQMRGTISDKLPDDNKRVRLISMFTNCSKLEHLEFHPSLFSFGTSSEIMDELGDAVPPALLKFCINCKCSPQELDTFLEKCRANLQYLVLGTDGVKTNINDEILVIVRKYATSKRSLKKLIMAGLEEQSIDLSRELEATKRMIKVDITNQYTKSESIWE